MGIAQYIVYLLGGTALLYVLGAYMGASAGIGMLGVMMILASFVIVGFCSGLSFFLPRVSSSISLGLSLPFVYVGLIEPGMESLFFLLPSLLIFAVSSWALIWPTKSIWSGQKGKFGAAAIIVFALGPAVFVVYILASFFRPVTVNL